MEPRELAEALRALGVSHTQFGRDLGVSDRTVRYWLAGTYRIPAAAIRLARESLRRGYYRPPKS